MRKTVSVFFCLMLLYACNAFAQTVTVTPPAFQDWPVKISSTGVGYIAGNKVPSTTDTYYDNTQTQDAKNIVLDFRAGGRHSFLWYVIVEKDDDTITVQGRFFAEINGVLVLHQQSQVSLPTADFYTYLKKSAEYDEQ